LLGFEDEAASFVEVDVTEALGAVGVGEDDFALEDVGVFGGVAGGGLGTREVERFAELG
jgi:hypothetical protein